MKRLARLAQVGCTVALATAATGTGALTANPDGLWSGTVKCTGKSQSDLSPTATLGPFAVNVDILGNEGIVENRFGTNKADALYLGAYFPDPAHPAAKGTLGFALAFSPLVEASETGQSKLETKKDGKITMDGKSYLLADFGDAFSGSCDWKLTKQSDPLPP